MEQPKNGIHTVSVIIPTIGRDTLARTRAGLARQTRLPDEVIINEDMERRGVSWNRNVCIQRARGDLVAFLDDDCVPPDEWLETLVGAIDRHGADGAGGTYEDADRFLGEVRKRRKLPEQEVVDTIGVVGNGGCTMYTRAILNDCLRRDGFVFSEARPQSEDAELQWRLRRRGATLIYVPLKVLHLKRLTSLQYMPYQFQRGTSIAPLFLLQRNEKSSKHPIHRSLLWDGAGPTFLKWARLFWCNIIGPFDVQSFSRFSFFVRFWFGEKVKALGFLWGIAVCYSEKKRAKGHAWL